MKYAVEFWNGKEWKRWNGFFPSIAQAWREIYYRREWADHIERRVVEVLP